MKKMRIMFAPKEHPDLPNVKKWSFIPPHMTPHSPGKCKTNDSVRYWAFTFAVKPGVSFRRLKLK